MAVVATAHWHRLDDGRVQCDVCPRNCRLHEGQRGFCQNWDISKSRETDTLAVAAGPEELAREAERLGCRSIAFTYNDPVIFMEYAMDVADACRERGIKAVAVSAGYMNAAPREEFYRHIDAANIDLKAFSERFYEKVTFARLDNVLETLEYLRGTDVWLEVTTLLIPGQNDGDDELHKQCDWLLEHLGPDVPLHFSAFHPDFKMRDVPATPPATLQRARRIALDAGLRFVYTGNVRDPEGQTTHCPGCGTTVIGRDWYDLTAYHLTDDGRCTACGAALPGVFEGPAGTWGRRRLPVRVQ
jgi:pyruvate formate lyase activating enzyme